VETIQGKQKILTDNFTLWCKKLNHLTDEEFKRGVDQVEYNIREAAKFADDIWPPSYAAFLGYCEKPHGHQAYKSFKPVPRITDKNMINRRKKAGRLELGKMRSMFE